MGVFKVTIIVCCVVALSSSAVVPAPAAVLPFQSNNSPATPYHSYNAPDTSLPHQYHPDNALHTPYDSDNAPDTPYHSEDAPAEFHHYEIPPNALNHPDATTLLNEDQKFLGSHLLYVINNNMGSVAAATLGSLFGPFGAYVSAFIQPPISQTLKHFSGGVISRENDEPLELLD